MLPSPPRVPLPTHFPLRGWGPTLGVPDPTWCMNSLQDQEQPLLLLFPSEHVYHHHIHQTNNTLLASC